MLRDEWCPFRNFSKQGDVCVFEPFVGELKEDDQCIFVKWW